MNKVTTRRASEDEKARRERDALERTGPEELRRKSTAGQFTIPDNVSKAERRKSSVTAASDMSGGAGGGGPRRGSVLGSQSSY